jgi:hypothetical protein
MSRFIQQSILRLMWHPKVYNIFHKLSPLFRILIQIRLHMRTHCYFKIHFIVILFQYLDLPEVFPFSSFWKKAHMDEILSTPFAPLTTEYLN